MADNIWHCFIFYWLRIYNFWTVNEWVFVWVILVFISLKSIFLLPYQFYVDLWLTLLIIIRWTLESLAALEPRKSVLEDDFEEEEEREENEQLDGLDNGADGRVSFLPNLSNISIFPSFISFFQIAWHTGIIYQFMNYLQDYYHERSPARERDRDRDRRRDGHRHR